MTPQSSNHYWPIIYRVVLRLVSPTLLIMLLYQTVRAHNITFFQQRLGWVPRNHTTPLWIHAASVGEVKGVVPLLLQLRAHYPTLPLLLTTTTSSGAQVLHSLLPGVVHHYQPIDLVGCVSRFLNRVAPRALIVVETELWPTLYQQLHQRGIPIQIINGRLSARTMNAPRWLRQLYAITLAHVDAIWCRSDLDRDRFIALGAEAARCTTLGNLKYAALLPSEPQPSIIPTNRPYILLASSREAEELLFMRGWDQLQLQQPPPLVVIAPRHPKRRAQILSDLAPYQVAVRSAKEQITDNTNIYLVDTLGELSALCAHSLITIMGGSWVPKGGHNLLEPAALGCCVIVGPFMDNFASECAELLAHDAVIQLSGSTELPKLLASLLEDEPLRSGYGIRASQLIAARRGVVHDYMQALAPLLERVDSHP